MKIQESAENYLEAVLVLKLDKGVVRSIDVAHYLGFSKPSVSRAMGLLRERGQITTSSDGFIELTEEGLAIAKRIYERHQLVAEWLVDIGVSPKVAAEDACRIEHDLSSETFEHLKTFILKNK